MPEDIDVIGKSLSLINSGDASAALVLLEEAIAVSGEHFEPLFLKGEALRCLGHLEQAEQVFQQALHLGPGNGEVLFRLGLTQHALNKLEAALVSLREATGANPGHQQSWFYAGVLSHQLHAYDDAIAAFRRACDLDPGSLTTVVNLAMSLQRAGQLSAANEVLQRAIQLDPTRDDLGRTLFQGLTEVGDFAAAETLVRTMAEHHPESSWWAGVALGWVLRNVHRDAEAATAYLRAFALEPNTAEHAAQAGLAYRHANQPQQAKDILTTALELDPTSAIAQVGMAGILSDEGDFNAALERLRHYADGQEPRAARRSVVIPILDYSPGSPYNIRTLLDDLQAFDGEVICIFNNMDVFSDLKDHPRIDKFSVNKHNVGVSRAWNMGINQAEGDTIHILNADLHISVAMLDRLEHWLHTLPDALVVGVSAHWYDPVTLKETGAVNTGRLTEAIETDNVSGQLFSLHATRLHEAGISFDPRLAPYFGEELDLSLKARHHGLKLYAVPETEFEHSWGISRRDRPIFCFGRPVHRQFCIVRNETLLRQRARRLRPSCIDPDG